VSKDAGGPSNGHGEEPLFEARRGGEPPRAPQASAQQPPSEAAGPQPHAVNPAAVNPGATNPGATNPGATNPGAANPGAADPDAAGAARAGGAGWTPRLVADNRGLAAVSIGKSFKKRPVLRDVTVAVERGEAVGLLGPNGAGKTTSFYIVMGLLRPDTGYVVLDGHDITDLPMYRRARLGIGYLPQEASIFRGLTVEQNVRGVLEAVEPNRQRREQILEELLAEFGIAHLRRAPATALSGGERRRCEIARALASQPNFILLDEPLAGIDPIAVNDIRELVSHLRDRGIGVLITDHNVRETLEIVDRAYIIHDGRVLMEGTPDEIVAHHDVRRVYLGETFSL
jgi:lipopolysaccharide export system ATP-binding protein